MKKVIAKIIMCISLIVLAIFSIMRLLNSNCAEFGKHITSAGANMSYGLFQDKYNGVIFVIFLAFMIGSYLVIIHKDKCDCECENKKEENELKEKSIEHKNKHKKKLRSAIIIIALTTILSFFILPNNSGDVWYYMAIGRLDSTYNVNSYQENFKDIKDNYKEDAIVSSSYAYNTTFAYGAVWHFICTTLGRIPTNNTLVMLSIFKMFNLLVHILNCILIYKISKKHKIRNMLIYALNPLIIFEGLINVHNDLVLLTTILGAIYFKKNNKLYLAVLSIAIGALIKYVPILLLPFILNKEKSKLNVFAYILEAAAIYIVVSYLVIGNIKDIFAFMVQTSVIANSLYLTLMLKGITNIGLVSKIGKGIFILVYLVLLIKMLIDGNKNKNNNANVNDENISAKYLSLLGLFIFLCITNFRAWYIIWLFGLLTEVDWKTQKIIIGASFAVEISNIIVYSLGEWYVYGEIYFYLTAVLIVLTYALVNKCDIKKISNNNNISKNKLEG